MVSFKHHILLLLPFLGVAVSKTSRASFSLRRPKAVATAVRPSVSSVLKFRGGASPLLDPDTVAKVVVGFVGVQGAVGFIAQEQNKKLFGAPPEPAFDDNLYLDIIGMTSSCALMMGLQLFKSMSFEKALGLSVIPYLGQVLYRLFTGKLTAVGVSNGSAILLAAIQMVTMYANLNGVDWATNWSKFYGLFSLLNAVVFISSPELGAKSWNVLFENMGVRDYGFRCFGALLAGQAALVAGPLFMGWSMMESIGWLSAVWSAGFLNLVWVAKDLDKFGGNKVPLTAWSVILAVTATTTLLKK
jgi:hypothetical protein